MSKINKNTGNVADEEEIEEWEELNRTLPSHNYSIHCDCRQCKGEKFKEV